MHKTLLTMTAVALVALSSAVYAQQNVTVGGNALNVGVVGGNNINAAIGKDTTANTQIGEIGDSEDCGKLLKHG
jgi:hypothetical protein